MRHLEYWVTVIGQAVRTFEGDQHPCHFLPTSLASERKERKRPHQHSQTTPLTLTPNLTFYRCCPAPLHAVQPRHRPINLHSHTFSCDLLLQSSGGRQCRWVRVDATCVGSLVIDRPAPDSRASTAQHGNPIPNIPEPRPPRQNGDHGHVPAREGRAWRAVACHTYVRPIPMPSPPLVLPRSPQIEVVARLQNVNELGQGASLIAYIVIYADLGLLGDR